MPDDEIESKLAVHEEGNPMSPVALRSPAIAPHLGTSRLDFLRSLYGETPPGHMVLWWRSNKRSQWLPASNLEQAATLWSTRDVYFGVALQDQEVALRLAGKSDSCEVRGRAESAIALPGLWADLDISGPAHKGQHLPSSSEEALNFLDDFPLAPTAVIDSGYGLQVWWLFSELWIFQGGPDREAAGRLSARFNATIEVLAAQYSWKFDNTSDLARVLRLPDTENAKLSEVVPVRVAQWHPERRYDLKGFEAIFVEQPASNGGRVSRRVDMPTILNGGAVEGRRDNDLFAVARKLRRADVPYEMAEKLVLEAAAKCTPPFPENEARAKVASAYRYPPGETSGGFVSSQAAEFPPLKNLPPLLSQAPSLPPDLLPGALRPWLVDIADRMQVPLEMASVPAIVAIASVVGRRIGIYPKAKDDWLVVPNLWGAIVARPGKMKTPTLDAVLKPIRHLAAESKRQADQLEELNARLDSLKAKETAIRSELQQAHKGKGELTPEELEKDLSDVRLDIAETEKNLTERRYIVNDSTVEKLGVLLAENPIGLLLIRDELAGWWHTLERRDRKGDREFYLETWSGTGSYSHDRIGRGTVEIPAMCLSIIGGVQPSKLQRYVSEALAGGYAADGLLQRFQLLVWPEDSTEWQIVDRMPNSEARDRVLKILTVLDRDLGEAPAEDQDIPAIRFADDAQRLYFDWWTTLETKLRTPEMESCSAFESHLAKYRGLMPRLALVFHLVGFVDSRSSLTLEALPKVPLAAASWCDFLEMHARKVFATELDSGAQGAHLLARKIQQRQLHDGMTVRDLRRKEWSGLTSDESLLASLAQLEEHAWVKVDLLSTGGRPSQIVRVNPAALKEKTP